MVYIRYLSLLLLQKKNLVISSTSRIPFFMFRYLFYFFRYLLIFIIFCLNKMLFSTVHVRQFQAYRYYWEATLVCGGPNSDDWIDTAVLYLVFPLQFQAYVDCGTLFGLNIQ